MSNNHIYLDCWLSTTQPIEIPKIKNDKIKVENHDKMVFELKTGSGDILVVPCSFNRDLITGFVDNTPPKNKEYKKGDKVIFHKHNVINIT